MNDCGRLDEGLFFDVIPVIGDDPFLDPPSCFELPEPFVFGLGPAKTEGPVSFITAPFDRRPHDQIVCPKMQPSLIRGPIFVHDLIEGVEVNICGDDVVVARG